MYRLRLLGGVLLDGPDGPVSGRATQQRRLALLALVGSAGDRGRSRDQLISLLWPETDPRDARQHLSHSIYALRKSLGEEAVRTAGEYVRLSASEVEVDSLVFESAVDRGERAAAADVYAGPFLDGFFIDGAPEFEHWVDEERRRLAKLYVESLEEAGAEADQAGDYAASIRWWGRLVDQDPYNSATVVKLMQTLWAAGDPANALLAADEHAKRLRLDLGFEPTAEVVDLAASVRGSQRRRPTGKAWDSDPQAPQKGLPSATPAGPKRHTLHWRLAAATAGVIVALVAGWLARRPDNAGSGRPHRSLAVIPFVNLTGEPAAEYLVDGVTDQLIAVLSRVPDLRVPAQTSSFQFKDRALDVRAISDSLGVDHILEGSVGPTDTGFRVTAQLIDASTGYHLWTETYERQPARLPGVEEEIARATLEELGVELADSVWPAGGRTRDPAAWQDYARARHWWSKRTPAGTDTALAYFRRAVDSDPGWALAWSGLADAYTTGVFWGHLPSDDSIAAVTRAAAERAVQLDSMLAEAWASYAAVLHDIDGDYEGAAREFGRAIDLNPNYSVARLWYGETLFMKLGRYAEGLREIRAAYAIDPLSPIIVRMLADFLWWSPGGAEEALRYFGLALDLEPGHWPSHSNEAKALACLGRDDEARASLTRLRDLFPDVPRALLDAADVLEILGEYAEAGAVIDGIRGDFPPGADYAAYFSRIAIGVYVEQGRYADAMVEYRRMADLTRSHSPNRLALTLAWIYARSGDDDAAMVILESVPSDRQPGLRAEVLAALGEHEKALDNLKRVVAEEHVLWDVACIRADPDFDAARALPQYAELVELMDRPVGD